MGPEDVLGGEEFPVHCRMFSPDLGLCSLDAGSSLLLPPPALSAEILSGMEVNVQRTKWLKGGWHQLHLFLNNHVFYAPVVNDIFQSRSSRFKIEFPNLRQVKHKTMMVLKNSSSNKTHRCSFTDRTNIFQQYSEGQIRQLVS